MPPAEVVQALLEYAAELVEQGVGREADFVDAATHPEWAPANQLLLQNPFAFLLGVIYDQGQGAESAWRYPYQLQQQLGHLDPRQIADMHLIDLDRIFETTAPRLRYPRVASARTLRAAELVCRGYEGDASRIWDLETPSPSEIERHFREFDGIGQKKASMATNILYRDLRWIAVPQELLREIDVSYDRHVRRVFMRAGLADVDSPESIIASPRRLNPDYPGALDLPAWAIGRRFCSNADPRCDECPLSQVCAKRIQYRT